MKRFEFSLEKLMDYKNQLLTDEKQRLAELRARLDKLNELVAKLKAEYACCNELLNERSRTGLAPMEISQRKAYLNALNERIKLETQQLRMMELKVSEQVSVVVRISQDISALDKLKERQFEEYRMEESREYQLLIEEFVANSAITL